MRAGYHTKLEKPSRSVVSSVCYPIEVSFTSKATRWGCDHEKYAISDYMFDISQKHPNVIAESRLIINPNYPQLGASPDGIVECSCCGSGLVEVKCP